MNSVYLSFLKRLFIFSTIIGLLSFLSIITLPPEFVSVAMPYLLLFFFLVTSLSHYFVLNAINQRTSRFVNYFMISIFVKLVFYSVLIVLYSMLNKEDIIPFIIIFVIFYLFFTVFELSEILKATKKDIDKSK